VRASCRAAASGVSERSADAHGARGHALVAGEFAFGLDELAQRLAALRVVAAACIGKAHLARGAHKELHAQAGFEPRDRAAHRGGCEAGRRGGRGEALQLGRQTKQLHAAQHESVELTRHSITSCNQ